MIVSKSHEIHFVEHMIHQNNLQSVLLNGILSHNEAYQRGLISEDIAMTEVQERRKIKKINVEGKVIGIHDFVSFYFNTKNPMLYKRKDIQHKLYIILISADIINSGPTDPKFAIFTDGNAGSNNTKFYYGTAALENIDLDMIFGESWNSDDEETKRENRRRRCAEVLVYPRISVSDIQKIICPNQTLYNTAVSIKNEPALRSTTSHIKVEIMPGYYF